MSINVTVNGDAIRINRGSMINYDADSEFERRKQIRFQQVREQSKQLSADVRSRVKRERERQLTNVEREGERRLKNWKMRKLHNLNKRCDDCINECGVAHTSAAQERDPNDILNERTNKNQYVAEKRGKAAMGKERLEKKQRKEQASKDRTRRTTIRNMENARSSLVANLKKGGKKRKPVSKNVADSEKDESESGPFSSEDVGDDSWDNLGERDVETHQPSPEIVGIEEQGVHVDSLRLSGVVSDEEENLDAEELEEKSIYFNRLNMDHLRPCYSRDSRISERISKRQLMETGRNKGSTCSCRDRCLINDLPYVPTCTLRKDAVLFDEKKEEYNNHKEKYYDSQYSNNFVAPIVQKISKESVQLYPSNDDEQTRGQFEKNMVQRDKEAQDRGRQAGQKVRLQKEFKKLMDELPALQKQERLASMRSHNKDLHMSAERLEECERQRQSRIDNIFQDYYAKKKELETPIITVKPVEKPPEKEKDPFKILDLTESPPRLNLAEWNQASDKSEIEESDSDKVLDENRETIINLLENVKKQRDSIRVKYSANPLSTECCKPTFISVGTSPISSPKTKTDDKQPTKVVDDSIVSVAPASSERIVEKRERLRKKYLKHEETQTSAANSPRRARSPKDAPQKSHSPKKDSTEQVQQVSKDNLCEIIIKMKEESNVKIIAGTNFPAKSPKKAKIRKIHRISKSTKQEKECQTVKPHLNYDISTSTSYLSAPGIITQTETKKKVAYKDLLHRKPQQANVAYPSGRSSTSFEDSPNHVNQESCPANGREINPRLVKYIKKLLNMSRKNIDELTVSSVSNITSPGTSTLNTSTNTSLIQLQNVMNYFNLSVSDIQRYVFLSDSRHEQMNDEQEEAVSGKVNTQQKQDESTIPQNSGTGQNVRRSELRKQNEERESSKGKEQSSSSTRFVSLEDVSEFFNEYLALKKRPDQRLGTQEEHKSNSKQVEDESSDVTIQLLSSTFDRYAELSQNCTTRIATLKSLIQKIRQEREILSNSSTSLQEDSSDISNGSRKIIDQEKSNSSISYSSIDRLILTLEEEMNNPPQMKLPIQNGGENISPKTQPSDSGFVSILPGLPKSTESNPKAEEEVDSLKRRLLELMKEKKPKPPPALLRNCNRRNCDLDLQPHELSTIMENDMTLISDKDTSAAQGQTSPGKHKMQPGTSMEQDTVGIPTADQTSEADLYKSIPRVYIDESPKKQLSCSPKCKKANLAKQGTSEMKDVEQISNEHETKKDDVSGVQLLSDRSTSSSEEIQRMLQGLGLTWALQTVKKTQESFALSSSSSSGNTSMKTYSNSSSNSRDGNKRQSSIILSGSSKRLEQSIIISGISPDSQDVSRTPRGGSRRNSASHRRTSTPIEISAGHISDEKDDNKTLFSADSEISSVQLPQDLFLSIPNETLDASVSLEKKK